MYISDMIEEADQLLFSIDKLSRIQSAITKYGWTSSLESLYGDELRSYSVEATVREIGHAVGKGIARFAQMLLNIIYKVIGLIKNVFTKSRKSAIKDINAIADKLPAMQNKRLDTRCATIKNMTLRLNQLEQHLKTNYLQDMEFNEAEEITAVRTAYLNKYNSMFGSAKVGSDYRIVDKLKTMEGKAISKYGFTSKEVLLEMDNVITSTFNAFKSRLREIETAGKDVAKVVKTLRANPNSNDGGNTTTTQGAYVYVRILYNDIVEVRRVDKMFKNAIVSMKILSEKYTSKAPEPEPNNEPEKPETSEDNTEQAE